MRSVVAWAEAAGMVASSGGHHVGSHRRGHGIHRGGPSHFMAAEVAMAEVIAEVMAAATRGLFLTFASRFQRAFLRMLESKPWQM
jgi:hypothetical protein